MQLPVRLTRPAASALIAGLALAGATFVASVPRTDAATQTLTFRPVADARVDQSTPSTNYGTSTYIAVDAQPYVHSYLRFAPSGVSGTITKATLRVYTLNIQDSGFYLYRVASNSWSETGITWNNAPAFGSQLAWSGSNITSGTWYSLDVTPYVTGNGTYSFGLSALSWAHLGFSSREGTYPPQLVITTNIASPTPAPTATRTATPGPTAAPTATPTATPGPTNTPAQTVAPTPTPTPLSTAMPTPTPTPTPQLAPNLRWGLIGNDGTHLSAERGAGINTKLLELSWSAYEPTNGGFSSSYISAKKSELAALESAGFNVILSFGVQYAPSWLLSYPNAYYVDQYGDSYNDTCSGCEIPNFVFNSTLRTLMDQYMGRVLADLGASNFAAVRLGGGHYGELGYPTKSYGSNTNTYWAFDANAQASSPVPGWKPGMASPNGEASKFLNWYLQKLTDYQTWQIATARKYYAGPLMVLYPSFGIRPGQADAAIAVNLNGSTSPEINGEVQRGYDYARQVAAITDPNVWVDSTWLDCPYGNDGSTNPVDWRPVHYLAYLATQNPLRLRTYGENTGQGSASVMTFTQSQAKTYGLQGFVWFNESELFSGQYATLSNYQAIIAANP